MDYSLEEFRDKKDDGIRAVEYNDTLFFVSIYIKSQHLEHCNDQNDRLL